MFMMYIIDIAAGTVQSKLPLMACRRNNKEEKRKRNKEYARKYQSKVYTLQCHSRFAYFASQVYISFSRGQTGESRKKVVVEFKRGIVAANEAKFQAELFKLTTDDDMPAYSGFDFIA